MTEESPFEKGYKMSKTSEAAKANGKTDSLPPLAAQAGDAIEKTVTATQEKASQVAAQASDEFRKMSDASMKFVRENPGAAVAGAVGVGLLLGLALRGRD